MFVLFSILLKRVPIYKAFKPPASPLTQCTNCTNCTARPPGSTSSPSASSTSTSSTGTIGTTSTFLSLLIQSIEVLRLYSLSNNEQLWPLLPLLMSTLIFKVCALDRSSSILFNEYRHLTQAHTKALVVRAAAATARLRRPRADRAPATPLQKRRRLKACHSLQKLIQRRLFMASTQEIRRRSSIADRAPVALLGTATATTTMFASGQTLSTGLNDKTMESQRDDAVAMPPPPPRGVVGDASPTRQSISTSPTMRNANRLSLTLPIAPPSSDPSRPTPTYATASYSIPPTPIDTSVSITPVEGNEFIIAIAAQERRVLDLKEELARAEAELSTLKKQWASQEAYSKKREQTPRRVIPSTEDDSIASRRSIDSDRRRSLMLQTQATPPQNRRKVLRGGHTRTLSLLSPPKSDSGFGILDDDPLKLPPLDRRTAQLVTPNISKRASWAPQSHRPQTSVPGLVEDFRLGLKAFVEDIRQITVGDEPISGPAARTPLPRSDAMRNLSGDRETIRPSNAARPKVSTAFDSPSSATTTPTLSSRARDSGPLSSRSSKRFSWTPLSFDSLDDNGWSNWESPASAKSTRWSGSTINSGGGTDDIESIPETVEETEEPV